MSTLIPSLRGAIAVPGWAKNELWRRARALPSLDLRFAENKSLVDARTGSNLVTFTRASTGTYVGADGLIKTAAVNEARFDHNPTTGESLGLLVEEQRTNLLLWSEEFNDANWSAASTPVGITPNTEISPTGQLTADTLANTANTSSEYRIVQFISSSAQLCFSVYVKKGTHSFVQLRTNSASSGHVNFDLDLVSASASTATGSIVNVGGGWRRCVAVFPAASITSVQIQLVSSLNAARAETWTPVGTISVHLWGAQLEAGAFPTSYIPTLPTFVSRASTATFFDANGVIQTAGVNVARSNAFLPDSSGVMRSIGLLAEEARTNSIRNNTMVGAVAGTPGTLPTNWSYAVGSGGLSREIVGTGTENGINYIDFRFYGTTTNTNAIAIGIDAGSAATGQTWTGSLYWKLVGGSLTGIIASTVGLIENTSGGVFVSGAFYTVNNPSGSALSLQRVSATRTLSGGATVASCLLVLNFTVTNSTAIDLTLRIGLPQLEQGAFATSVIPTSGTAATRSADVTNIAAATRSADVASITGAAFSSWYRQDEGTIYSDFRIPVSAVQAGARIYQASDSTGTNLVWGRLQAGTNRIYDVQESSTSQASFNFGASTANTSYKGALAFKSNDFAGSDTGSALTDTSGSVASSIDHIGIGMAPISNGSQLNGTIRRLTYWPVRLANSILQSITA